MMKLHKEGHIISLTTLVLLALISYLIFYLASTALFLFSLCFFSIFYLWILYFFRNPTRTIVQNEQHIISPADGKVILIEKVFEEEYFKDYRTKISIFMSPFNVHVNRNPITGRVKFLKYHPGKYLVAWHPKSSLKNERTTIVVEHIHHGAHILYRQIAGTIARRIKRYIQVDSPVQQGEEFGFIKFGSRVDIYLPLDAIVHTQIGTHVQGGISILAHWPS